MLDPNEKTTLESAVSKLIQDYGILVITASLIFLFKDTFGRWWHSFIFFWRGEYKEDDVISLNGKPARIIRTGVFKTVFFVYNIKDGKVSGGSKMVIHNDRLSEYHIEKPLPPFDLSPWLDKKEKTNE